MCVEKYKSLNELQKQISQFVRRFNKENNFGSNVKLFSCINDLTIKDDVIMDIISLICHIGNIEIDFLIYEINRHIGLVNRVYDSKINYIKSHKELCEYIRGKISPVTLLVDPLSHFFMEQHTIKGKEFYQKIRKQLNDKLFLYNYIYAKS